jgi:hypothetical protein
LLIFCFILIMYFHSSLFLMLFLLSSFWFIFLSFLLPCVYNIVVLLYLVCLLQFLLLKPMFLSNFSVYDIMLNFKF